MRDFPASSPAVVVGINGSPTAVDAALWAVDEAVSRDIPLRLVYAIDPDNPSGTDPRTQRVTSPLQRWRSDTRTPLSNQRTSP